MSNSRTRRYRGQVIQSIAALAASSAIFAVLAVRGAFSDAQTGSEGFARLAVGAGFALGVIGVVLTFRMFQDLWVAETRRVPEPSHWFSLVLSADGLAIWSGIAQPKRLMQFPTSVIRSVDVGAIGPSVNGLNVTVEAAKGDFELRLPVLGAGPFGMFTRRLETVQALAANWQKVASPN